MNKLLFYTFCVIVAASILWCCNSSPEELKFKHYYAQGELIYQSRCSNCHQRSGEGLRMVYPPVNKSDYIDKHFDQVVCLIKYGIKGELIVNGQAFNQPMPGIPKMTDLEIAELTTYLYNNWGRKRGVTDTKVVTKLVENCL